MSEENAKTLAVCERLYGEFLKGTARRAASRGLEKTEAHEAEDLKVWVDGFSGFGRGSAEILEIGSGDGAGALRLSQAGFSVTPSDAVAGFLSTIRENGMSPIRYNVLTDTLDRKFDGVLAWHVFLHFTEADFETALAHVHEILRENGRLVFDLQNIEDGRGFSDGWVDYDGDYHLGERRYFCYWSEKSVREKLSKAGFKVISVRKYGSDSGIRWLQVVAERG